MWNLDEPICKTEIETKTQRANMDIKAGRRVERTWKLGLIYIKQTTNENLLYSTGEKRSFLSVINIPCFVILRYFTLL